MDTSSTTFTIGNGLCPSCGRPYTYVGDYFGGPKPWCTCAADARVTRDAYKLVMNAPIKGWECPKCGAIYSPHVPSCFECSPKPQRIAGLSLGSAHLSPDFDKPLMLVDEEEWNILRDALNDSADTRLK